jgi:putative tryptophan/tyrosine transport system substrate-binding protein
MPGMRRREFVSLLSGAAAAWPVAAFAQQPAMPVIGILGATSAAGFAPEMAAFRQGLQASGYREGQNVTLEQRWANNEYDRLPSLAADLVGRQVTVISAIGGNPVALAAKAATKTIPIVFYVGADPVQLGLVASLNRPGENVTGVAGLNVEVGPKRLELLHELRPTADTAALLVNPTNPNADKLSTDLERAAQKLGLTLRVLHAKAERDFDTVFAGLAQLRAGALLIGGDGLFRAQSEQLAALSVRYSVPSMFQYREFAAAGGLMSYGGNIIDSYHLVGTYTARVLKGEKPANLPVQQSTKAELIINIRTAKLLGIDVPPTLLARADEVIE